VSDAVLDAVARVLPLDPTEQEHLRNLARPGRTARNEAPRQRVRSGLQRMLDTMTDAPAFIVGRRMDILAWNRLADAVSDFQALPPGERNAARHTFLHPDAREFYPDWDAVAAETVGYLRLDAGRHADDRRLAELIGELSMNSETFRRLWARHDVNEKTHGTKWIHHPVVGELRFDYETFAPPGDPDQLLVAYLAQPGSPTEERLRLLASWTAPQAGTAGRPPPIGDLDSPEPGATEHESSG
jgi:hypothetical protein